MKILLVITKSEIGGAQVFVLNLASALKKLGVDVEVAAGYGDYLLDELKKKNIPCYYMNSLKRDVSIFSAFYFIYDFYRLLRNKHYDVIHLNSSNTLFGAVSAFFISNRPKILFTFHGLSLLDHNYQIDWFIRKSSKIYFKIFLKLVDKSVFVSQLNCVESINSQLVKDGEVIYNGLDQNELEFLSKERARAFFSEKCNADFSDSYLMGSTGRLAYQKNYEFLINNFLKIREKINNVKVLVIGDGPDREKLKSLLTQHNIQNDFFLAGSLKDSYQYIKAFDIFTLPSRYEGLSISLIEALFAEVPILASDVGGNCEVVGKDSGQLYKLDDIDDYINKMTTIKNDPQKYIEHNKLLKDKFSLDKMANEYLRLYTSLVEQ